GPAAPSASTESGAGPKAPQAGSRVPRVGGESMLLSVLDQSPVRSGSTPADAIHETLDLAQAADRLGYHRYWLAEHDPTAGPARALRHGPGARGLEHFPNQIADLSAFLGDGLPAGHPFAGVRAMPTGPTAPDVWLLGSSGDSAAYAAHFGTAFSFAHFINDEGG